MIKINLNLRNGKTMVMIIGHTDPNFIIDTADSIRYYNNSDNYEIVFAIDFNKEAASILINKYGEDRVFVSKERNGWGRGILRTIIHALDYFGPRINCHNLITMDSDSLCVGPFINKMLLKIDDDAFFVGDIWRSPGHDHRFHFDLRNSGFMSEYPFNFRTELAAGPCMMWTSHCLDFLKKVGLMPATEFDKMYHLILFAHDQLSTYLNSCGVGTIKVIGPIMEIKWRQALATHHTAWGAMPIIHERTAIIHPVKSNIYSEYECRKYFRSKRQL